MPRLLNFRPFAVIAIIMAASVLLSLVAFNIPPLGIALLSVTGALCTAAATIYFVKKDKVKGLTFVLALVFSAIAVLFFFVTLNTRYALDENTAYTLSGRVTEHYGPGGDDYVFTLDTLTADGESIDGKMRVYIEDAEAHDFLICGYNVSFKSAVSANELIDGYTVNASGMRNGIRYYAYPDAITVLSPGQAEGLEAVRLGMKNKLDAHMDEDAASVAYGMIIGDRHYISDEVSDYFAAGGIGHILAVSGLHIGVLAAALSFLLKKCRVPRIAIPFIIMTLLVLYALLTGGSPSVIRACVMSFIMLLAPLFGRNDLLNSLCTAACVCLLISPFYLFEAGFIMSFSAVFGLATLAPVFTRLLKKIKLPGFIAKPLAASTAVQIAIIPATAYFFHAFYTYSLIVNAFMMPLLSLLYIGLIAALILSLILPFTSFLLAGVGFAVGLLITGCGFVAALPGAQLISHVNLTAFLVLPAMFLASDYVMVKNKARRVLYIFCGAAVMLSPLYSYNTFHEPDALVALNRGGTVIFGDGLYLTGEIQPSTTSILLNARISGDLYVYPTDMSEATAQSIIRLARTYTVKQVMIAESVNVAGLKTLLDAGFDVEMTTTEGSFTAAYVNGAPQGWLYNSHKTAYITHRYSGDAPDTAADVIRCKAAYSVNADKLYLTHYKNNEGYTNIMSNTDNGNIVYRFADGGVYCY